MMEGKTSFHQHIMSKRIVSPKASISVMPDPTDEHCQRLPPAPATGGWRRASPRVAARVAATVLAVVSLSCAVCARADEPASTATVAAPTAPEEQETVTTEPLPADGKVDFSADIQPIFATHCAKCHGADRHSGGLRLDTEAGAIAGGDSHKPILGGTLETNELYQRVSSAERNYRMPKNAPPLPAEELERIKRWVEQGTPWPRPAKADTQPQGTLQAWYSQLDRYLQAYQRELSDAQQLAPWFLLGQLAILIVARCRVAVRKQRPWTTGKARRFCALCEQINGRELFLAWLLLVMMFPLTIWHHRDRRVTAQLAELRAAQMAQVSPWTRTIFGFPPKPIRPAHAKQLTGTYYRGNCERNPALFNNGNYLTAVFRISLCDVQHKQLQVGDAVPPEGMIVRMELDRAPGTTDLLYSNEIIASVCLSEQFPDAAASQSKPQVVGLETLEEHQRWAADYRLDPLDVKGKRYGIIYVYTGWKGDETIPADPHYAIVYDLMIEDGKLAEDSEIWMNSFGNSAVNLPERPELLPYREWFDDQPIPAITGENTKDPKLLGVEEYVQKGLIAPPQPAPPPRENPPAEKPQDEE
jgi:mono/diheme cytochrome c family protein